MCGFIYLHPKPVCTQLKTIYLNKFDVNSSQPKMVSWIMETLILLAAEKNYKNK